MPKNVYYRYNPETDNFERVYPSIRTRLASLGKIFGLALLLAILILLILFYCFDSPTVANLRSENARLRSQYGILNKRMDNSLKILAHIQDRDDNFYRVMMQMEPLTPNQRLSGLENVNRHKELRGLSDASLVTRLSQSMDLLERQLYAQVQSFDQLRAMMSQQGEKLNHIPSVFPMKNYSIAAGYGYRRDPVSGISKLHEGLDFAAPAGTAVYATGDGVVVSAQRLPGFGNCVEIDHGYNYVSRYAHLRDIEVVVGDEVKRGEMIGRVGSTGKSTGQHLHYEVIFKEENQNPVNYFFMDLSPDEYSDMLRIADNAGHIMD